MAKYVALCNAMSGYVLSFCALTRDAATSRATLRQVAFRRVTFCFVGLRRASPNTVCDVTLSCVLVSYVTRYRAMLHYVASRCVTLRNFAFCRVMRLYFRLPCDLSYYFALPRSPVRYVALRCIMFRHVAVPRVTSGGNALSCVASLHVA